MKSKYAVLSIDIEDWYHLDYIKKYSSNEINYSMLDGLDYFLELVSKEKIPASYFVLSSIISKVKDNLNFAIKMGGDVNSHGIDHKRPLTMKDKDFTKDIIISKDQIENILGIKVNGYRAPCFSIDDKKLNLVREHGYLFDSSKINFSNHSLYGQLKLDNYEQIKTNIYRKNNFIEFELPTQKFFNKFIPISGGGYLRSFPSYLYKYMLNNFIKNNFFFFIYIHPFELSKLEIPLLVKQSNFKIKSRFNLGRKKTNQKLVNLITKLKRNNFEFTNFSLLRKKLLNEK